MWKWRLRIRYNTLRTWNVEKTNFTYMKANFKKFLRKLFLPISRKLKWIIYFANSNSNGMKYWIQSRLFVSPHNRAHTHIEPAAEMALDRSYNPRGINFQPFTYLLLLELFNIRRMRVYISRQELTFCLRTLDHNERSGRYLPPSFKRIIFDRKKIPIISSVGIYT